MVFQNVGFFKVISKEQIKLNFDHHCPNWIINGTWYNTVICSHLNGSSFEDYFTTTEKYRYNLMCSIKAYFFHPKCNDYESSGGGIPLPYRSATHALNPFGHPLNFIYSWL